MAGERWQLISRIFHEALAQPDGARDAFVRDACNGDAQLEHQLRALIAQPSSDSFLDGLMQDGSASVLDSAVSSHPSAFGRFAVRRRLGAGGMGEVYQAHDASLGRDVAIKILPPAFSSDVERLARFEREARVLAALSHPHIAAIYGVEEIGDATGAHAGRRALVLELVDGETLAERLHRSRLSITDAIEIATQIADGMEAAHDRGVVHRDLKPGNIKIRSDGLVKILDFGLAKADGLGMPAAPGSGEYLRSPETAGGVIVGTPAYMSPEQARGGAVDKRTDTWAFGCVVFEMITGHAPFAGDTPADVIAAVLNKEPDWNLVPPSTPTAVTRLLRRCLEKNPRRRLRDMGDARLELEEACSLPNPVSASKGRRLLASTSLAGAAILATALLISWLSPPRAFESVQFRLDAPDGNEVLNVPAPSPDGRSLAFVVRASSGESALWVRALSSTTAQRIAGTENATWAFWSPDGKTIGFTADKVLKRTAASGGPVQRITDLDPMALGATWNRDNLIVLTPSNQMPLHRVSASGGSHEPLTVLDSERRENSHRWPQFLPDGRHFVFLARSDLPQNSGIYVASLDNPHSPKWLVAAQSRAAYAPPGYLLFVRDTTLIAQPFDARTLSLTGDAVALAGNVLQFAVSADGTVLSYRGVSTRRLAWFDRSGVEHEAVPARGNFSQVRLSPDGTRAAVVTPDPTNGERDVWVVALTDGGITRITSHPSSDWFPAWSPDGSEIIFASERNDTVTFYAAPATGGGSERQIYKSKTSDFVTPTDWSADGKFVLLHSYPRGDVSLLSLAAPDAPKPVVESPFTDWVASFSPDGHWIAYVSDESGAEEVYVKAVNHGARYRVSVGGGTQPRWRRDGKELFFIGSEDKLYAVTVSAETMFHVGAPKPLFQPCPAPRAQAPRAPYLYRYDVTADGKRTLWVCGEDDAVSPIVALHPLASQNQ